MKKLLLTLAVAALGLAACAGAPTADQPPEVARVRAACAADAIIRPSVSALLDVPGLATLEQKGAIMAARSVIDPICANPAGARQAALAGLSAATGQVIAVYAELKVRRSAVLPTQ